MCVSRFYADINFWCLIRNLQYGVCTGLLIWWHYHVAYPLFSLCGIHGLSVMTYCACYLLNLVADWDCTLTFTATFVFPELSSRIFLATPSNTSPNAPLPRNLVNISWSRLKWGRAAISLSVGIILQKIMVSLLITY